MTGIEREAQALAKLLKVARARTDETSRRIGDLESALAQTNLSLRLLDDAVATEEAAAKAAVVVGFVHLAGYLSGAMQKRATMAATRDSLAVELEMARSDLSEAFSEMKRLELLVERARLAGEKRRRKTETALAEETAIARFVRTTAC